MLMLLGVSGCERRHVLGKVGTIAMVPVHIDWSKSGLKIEDISRVTVRVFPHNGSPAYNFVMQESKTDDVIPLVVGKYSFVIFNETTDPNDWNSLVFENADKYEAFMVTTADDSFKGLFSKVQGDIIRKSPDPLAVFSIDEFEVTPQMVSDNSALTGGAQEITPLTDVVPVSVVKHIRIIARVVNLVSAQKSSGAIKGAVRSIQMSTRKPIEAPVNNVFIMNGRKYDNPAAPKDGTIGALVTIFDPSNVENLKADFCLDFLLYDGSATPTEVFDITSDLKTDNDEVSVELGGMVEDRPHDRPIILPVVPMAGDNIGVDDWSDVVIPLQ